MPLIALALVLDLGGLGAPAWWAAGKSLELLIALAHWTAAQPGSVALLPGMGRGAFALFVAGGLWLALWSGRIRLWGLVPVMLGCLLLARLHTPDVLVSGDGRHVAIVGEGGELLVLRESRSDFAVDNLRELAGAGEHAGALGQVARCAVQRGFLRDDANRSADGAPARPQPRAHR